MTYWKTVHNSLGKTEGSIWMLIGQMVSVSWLNYLHLGEGFFAEVGWPPEMSKNAVKPNDILRRQINFDRDQERPWSTVWSPVVYRILREELSEICRVLFHEYIWEISASTWFYYKKFNMMHGHVNVKIVRVLRGYL